MHRERVGIAIELLAFSGGIWQTMVGAIPPQIGWPIIVLSASVGLYLIITGFRRKADVEKQQKNKAEAIKIYNNLVKIEKEFWTALDKVPDNENALENAEVKDALFKLQVTTNKLATLVNKREFDEFIEAMLSLYTKYAEFHFDQFNHNVTKLTNREHRKIRMYIRGIND